MMSMQEKAKENSSNVIKKREDRNLETKIEESQKNLAKKSGPKEVLKSPVNSSSENKINRPEFGTCMSTRSAKAASSDKKTNNSINKNVTVNSQQESKNKKKLSQKKSLNETSTSNEQLNRRSQRLQQLTEVSTRTLRSREIQGQVQAVKQNFPLTRKEYCSNTQSKTSKVKTNKKHVKRKVLEKSDFKEDGNPILNEVNSPKGKKRKVEHQAADTNSSHCFKGSDEKCHQKNSRKEETKPVPVTSEIKKSKVATSLISKKNETKKSVHTQVITTAKSQKRPQPLVPEQNVDNELEQAGKNKRGSILQLCEEIAGEIESDTVEVRKESSQIESVNEEQCTEVKLEETDVEGGTLHHQKTNQDVQCNRFFPSRKTKPVKCILNGINNSTKKNSNWTKIKLSKFNSVQQNKLDSQVSPKLDLLRTSFSLPALEVHHPVTQSTFLGIKPHLDKNIACQQEEMRKEAKNDTEVEINKTTKSASENCDLDNQIKLPVPSLDNQMKHSFESTPDKNFSLHLESKLEKSTVENSTTVAELLSQAKIDSRDSTFPGSVPQQHSSILSNQTSKISDNRENTQNYSWSECNSRLELTIPKELKLKETEKVDEKQLIIDAGQKRFGAVSCNVCGMLYTASNPEDETQHLLFHNQFISAVKYVGWKKERILAEYPDGRIIMVLPEDPKYALKKVDEIREMVDNDLGFQQAPLMCYSRTKTLLFISNDKKVVGCLIAEHIQWGYRVIEEKLPVIRSEEEKVRFERQKAWCCSTLPEPAICGISRIWVFSMMRRKKIASRMIECLRSNFIYGSYLSKEEIAFSDPTPDGKLFATQYCGTGQFLVYNFINGQNNT
ncbi:N-acetyltransferase ESCO1 [Sorex araneus]|uniref:N-acetyltransferase ESCO1 n=1 Tax=Sorex araneus TaxID=42254 RepID=UPI0003315C67|nr:N-acetyltransferase ESCO1 [Sorex araneus]XP_054982248.1 N-acetyltransferase ESCO1 [Sorex araneus]XP_054982249.1 N-acetyltransferase ESCO1 [Sorex araneus]XP_054982250.1 N-acetyltransferase ESCO1 [Sorex araneus]XP_054982251.1 N-acetyltransferase ESCO1 [Sorex araneus]